MCSVVLKKDQQKEVKKSPEQKRGSIIRQIKAEVAINRVKIRCDNSESGGNVLCSSVFHCTREPTKYLGITVVLKPKVSVYSTFIA